MKDPARNLESYPGSTQQQAPFMVLKTYLRQRFNVVTFGILALYLLAFTKANLSFQPSDIGTFVIALLLLMILRLYDDLQNASYDQHKPDRIYTDPANAKTLYVFVAVNAILVLVILTLRDPYSGVLLLLFLLVNHVLYLLLVNRSTWRYYLPLIKYPFIVTVIAGHWSTASLSLFFAFLTFDIIDDPGFPLPRWSTIITSLMAFVQLLPSASEQHLVQIGALAIVTCGLTLARFRYSGYVFLALLLLARFIDPLYEI